MSLLSIADLQNTPAEDQEVCLLLTRRLSHTYDRFVEEESDSHLRAPGVHASELSCLRKVCYSLSGTNNVPSPLGLEWKRRFKIGHAIHEMFQRDFLRMAKRPDLEIQFQEEVAIHPGMSPMAKQWQIFSHADGLFNIMDRTTPLVRLVLEIKSESPQGYSKLTAPKEQHVEQAHVYMKCLDAPLTWFLYYNKGNQNYTGTDNPSFLIRYSETIWQRIETRIRRAWDHNQRSVAPSREEGVQCQFCDYSWVCKPECLKTSTKSDDLVRR